MRDDRGALLPVGIAGLDGEAPLPAFLPPEEFPGEIVGEVEARAADRDDFSDRRRIDSGRSASDRFPVRRRQARRWPIQTQAPPLFWKQSKHSLISSIFCSMVSTTPKPGMAVATSDQRVRRRRSSKGKSLRGGRLTVTFGSRSRVPRRQSIAPRPIRIKELPRAGGASVYTIA